MTCNKASIAALPSAVACEGDTVTLTANEGVSYLWSTGETTQSISVNKQGYYSVTVVNENGCNLVSDPLFVKYILLLNQQLLQMEHYWFARVKVLILFPRKELVICGVTRYRTSTNVIYTRLLG